MISWTYFARLSHLSVSSYCSKVGKPNSGQDRGHRRLQRRSDWVQEGQGQEADQARDGSFEEVGGHPAAPLAGV